MEHIVQFGICVDDEKIKETISKNVEKAVIGKISKEIMEEVFSNTGYGNTSIRPWVYDLVGDIVDNNKDKIIEIAVQGLIKSMARTKIVKDKLKEIE